MTRTPGGAAQHRAPANAAGEAGRRLPRVSVVLYACIPRDHGQDPAKLLEQLRGYAEARNWVIAGEVVDHTTPTTPLEDRPNWPAAAKLITSGRATAIAIPSRELCADTCTAIELEAWLSARNAYLYQAVPHGAAR